MFRYALVAMLFFAALAAQAADPFVSYDPASGQFWVSGTQQPEGHASISLYSESGLLFWPAVSPFLTSYSLDTVPGSPSYGTWDGKVVSVTLPGTYTDPLFIGAFGRPGVPVFDLAAGFRWISLNRGLTISNPLSIEVVPEPPSKWLLLIAVGAALWTIARKRPLQRQRKPATEEFTAR